MIICLHMTSLLPDMLLSAAFSAPLCPLCAWTILSGHAWGSTVVSVRNFDNALQARWPGEMQR